MDSKESRPARPGGLGVVATIGLLSLGVRLTFVFQFVGHPLGRLAWVDEGAYWSRALEVASGRCLPDGPFYQDPLFPYVLSGLIKLVGPDVARVRIALACLGASTPLAVYWAGRRGLGRGAGVLAGLAAAVYGPLAFADGLIEKEGLGALAAAVAFGLTARLAAGYPRPGRAVSAGLAWGVVALLRSNAMVIAPLGAVWVAALGAGDGQSRVRRFRARALNSVGFVLGFALALSPVTAVNAVVGRPPELLLTTWQLGPNFYIGNGPESTGTYSAPDFVEANPAREAVDFAAEARRRCGRELTPGQVSRFWFAQGLRRWREAPGPSAALLAYKLGLVLHDTEIPDSQDPKFVRAVAAPALGLGVLTFGWLAPWAALGLSRTPRTPFWWFLVLSTAAGLGSTAAFFVVGRYRVPWAPGLFLLGAAGTVDLARRVRDGQWRSVAWRFALLMAPAAALAWRPLSDPAPDRWGHMLIALALAETASGRLDPAIDALDDARALGPGPALRIDQLLRSGPLHDALGALVARLPAGERRPGRGLDSDVRLARRMRQFRSSRPESRRLLDRALRADPDDPQALRERGSWWLGLAGDPDARRLGFADLTRAANGPAGDPSAAVLLALLVDDPFLLPRPAPPASVLAPSRLRLAHLILGQRRRSPPPGSSNAVGWAGH